MQFKFDRHSSHQRKIGLQWVHPRPSTAEPTSGMNDDALQPACGACICSAWHFKSTHRGAPRVDRPGTFSSGKCASLHTIIHFVDFLKAAKRETPIALTVDTMVRLFCLVAVATALVRVGYCLDNGLALTPQMVRPVAADCVRHLRTRQRLCVWRAIHTWRDT